MELPAYRAHHDDLLLHAVNHDVLPDDVLLKEVQPRDQLVDLRGVVLDRRGDVRPRDELRQSGGADR